MLPIVQELRAAGLKALGAIAAALNSRGVRTARGGRRLRGRFAQSISSGRWTRDDLRDRLANRVQLTSDGHSAYLEAVEGAFGGDATSLAVQRTRTTLPIVVLTDDIIRTRLVASLARPGGNITGVTIFAPELDRKRLEILLDSGSAPGRRVGRPSHDSAGPA